MAGQQQQQQEPLRVHFDKAGLPDFMIPANRNLWRKGLENPINLSHNFTSSNVKTPPPVDKILAELGVAGPHPQRPDRVPGTSRPPPKWASRGSTPTRSGCARARSRGERGARPGGAGNPEPQQQGSLGSVGPGDRGQNWARYTKKVHAIVEERWTHQKETCPMPWHRAILASGGPASFAFGQSVVVKEARLKEFIEKQFDLARRPQYFAERVKGQGARRDWYAKRKIRLMAWDVGLEKAILWLLNVSLENVELYDLQRHPDVMRFFGGQQAGASNFLASVGIRDVDKKYANLGHNAGNDAVFACAGFLALCCLTDAQLAKYRARVPITPALDYSWVGYTLDRVNVRPGAAASQSQKSARPPSQRNDNSQQPTMSANFRKAMSRADAATHEESEHDSSSDDEKIFGSQMVPYQGGGGGGSGW
ncbi:hypothetical protein PG987_009886 [Apiospora arundinis]